MGNVVGITTEIEPADTKCCQAEVKEGSFMTMGPRSYKRCSRSPVVIVVEEQPGSDGNHGYMSLCAPCLQVFKDNNPTPTIFVHLAQ